MHYSPIEALEPRTLLANTAGSLDPTFGPDGTGYVITDIGGGANYTLNDMAIDGNGRIIVVGDIINVAGSNTPNDIYVMAYNHDGALDPTFGTGGKLVINFGTADSARSVVIQSDGKIVIGGFTVIPGTTLGEDLLLARLNSDGTFDPSFGNGGRSITDIAKFDDRLLDITLQAGGKILGTASNNFSSVGRVVRYLGDGTLDPSFGNGGFATAAPFTFPSRPTGMMVQADGKIVIGGGYSHPTYGNILSLGRFNADGTLDNSFAFAPTVDPIVSNGSEVNFGLLPDGRFLASTGSDLVRINPDGSHDLTFSIGGVWRGSRGTPVQPGDLRGLVLDGMGKILSAGFSSDSTGQDVAILRQHDNGFADPSFGNHAGFDRIDLGGKPEQGLALALQTPDRLVVAGLTTNGVRKAFVMRLDASNVANVPPVANPGGPYHIQEGGLIRFDGSATADPDGGIDHYDWDFNYDGTKFDVDATGAKPLFNAAGIDGPSTRTIALRVTDSQYATTIATTTLQITDAAPVLMASGPPRIVPGSPYTLTLSATDAGQDTITSWHINWGDGSSQDLPGISTSASHFFANAQHAISIDVTATDEDGTHLANSVALDVNYANDGIATLSTEWFEDIVDTELDPVTGKLYVATSEQFHVYRFNTDGSLDTTWGVNGKAEYYVSSYTHSVAEMILQPDGKVLIGGDYLNDFTMIRYDLSGHLDPTFGQSGVARISTAALHGNEEIFAIILQPDGKIVAGGGTDVPDFENYVLVRLLPNGQLDPSFGTGGTVVGRIVSGTTYNRVNSLALQQDGKLAAAMSAGAKHTVARFNSDGSLDQTFNGTGYVFTDWGAYAEAYQVLIQSDGKIVVGGRVDGTGSFYDYNFGFLRLNSDGSPDSSFGTRGNGQVQIDISGDTDSIGNLLLMPDGGILAGGNTPAGGVLVKLRPDGQLDPLFSGGGIISGLGPIGLNSGISDGHIYLTGRPTTSAPREIHRFNLGPVIARANDAPAVLPPLANPSVDEGTPYHIEGTFSDADQDDPHQVSIDWGDGSSPTLIRLVGAENYSADHIYKDDNPTATPSDPYTVRITVSDGMDETSVQTSVTVNNVAPIAELGADRSGTEGDSFTFNPTRIDPGSTDTFTYAWTASRSNGTLLASGTLGSFTFVAPDNDTYTVRLKLTDDDGGQWNDSVAVTTLNAAPIVNLISDKSGQEGAAVTVTPSYSDKGSADTFTYKWNIYKPDGSLGWSYPTLSLSFTPPDNGTYRAVFSVTDDDGGVGSDEILLFISNVSPSLGYAANAGAYQGKAYQVSLSAADPGTDTISSWTINWGDGSPTEMIQGSFGPLSHVYTALATGVRITGSATDEDGTYSISTKTINVVPLPTLTADGTLLITGTPQNDTLSLSVAPGSDRLQVNLAGAITDYPLADVARFEASMGNGNDQITFPTSGIPGGIVRGEDGVDTMTVNASLSSPIQFIGGQTSTFLDVLNVNAGTFIFDSDPRVGAGRLNLVVTAASVVFNTSAHLEGLVLSNGSRATIAANGSRLMRLVALSVGGGSVLDLTDNDLIVQPPAANAASVASNISFLLKQAYNGLTRWQDASLTSSWAAADSSRTLGFMRNLGPKFTSFDGEAVDVNSTLVAHTVVGDLNLDRRVTISDFLDLSANLGKISTTWISGDVNYDTQTTVADFIALSSYFGQSLPAAAPAPAAPSAAEVQAETSETIVLEDQPQPQGALKNSLPQRHHPPRHRRHLHHATPRLVRRLD